MPLTFRALAIPGLLIVASCALQRAETAKAAQTSMVGMSKEKVLTCMGPAAQKTSEGGTEVWSYASGNGAVSSVGGASAFGGNSSAFAIGSVFSTRRFCTVNVVFKDSAVSALNYSGPTGGLISKGEQCAYAVENCVKQ